MKKAEWIRENQRLNRVNRQLRNVLESLTREVESQGKEIRELKEVLLIDTGVNYETEHEGVVWVGITGSTGAKEDL